MVDFGERRRHRGEPLLRLRDGRREFVEHLVFECQRPLGGGRNPALNLGQFDSGEPHRIRHGLAMAEKLIRAVASSAAFAFSAVTSMK